MTLDPASLPRCDSLYVAPHADDVLLSCAARRASERAQGLRTLVLVLFGPVREDEETLGAGLPEATARSDYYASFRARSFGRDPGDGPWLERLTELLADAGHRTRARQVYAPLGVGGHVDHRLAHEAALRALHSGEGRNVFLYEERPEAFVTGAVRMRLGEIGARLPPAAATAAGTVGLARLLLEFHVPARLRGDLRTFRERWDAVGPVARRWKEARRWRPLRGLGPGLQPIIHAGDAETGAAALAAAPEGARHRLRLLGAEYARRLGVRGHAERYWLVLPPRERDGAAPLPAPGEERELSGVG